MPIEATKKTQSQGTQTKPEQAARPQATEKKETQKSIFDEMTEWQQKHEENVKTASERYQNGDEDALEEYNRKQEEIGLEFNFMEGKDPSNTEEYNAQIRKLAQGEFEKKDANGDGQVTYEEYIQDELSGLSESDDEAIEVATKAYSYLMASLMDKGMGASNSNGVVDLEEFESFYKNLDRFNGEGLDETGDGKISVDGFDMPSWLVEQIFDQETIKNVMVQVLQGDI